MLKIRKEQMAVMEAHLNRKFRALLKQHVREEFPAETKDAVDSDLEKLITQAIARAREHGVTTERDVALFLDLMIARGPQFDRDPKLIWIRKILSNKDLDGSAKMETIYRRLAVLENRRALPDEVH